MKTRIINLIILMIMFAVTAMAISVLPDVVGVHFDVTGKADRFGSKYELLIMPCTMLLLQAALEFACIGYKRSLAKTEDEKEKATLTTNIKQFSIVSVITSLVMLVVNGFVIYASYNSVNATAKSIDVVSGIIAVLGIMLVIMGDRMPKTRINSMIGFRLPWTMYNDITWRKSNLFASFVMMLAGIIIAVCAMIFNGIVIAIILISIIIISALICTCYAYTVYKKEKNNEN